MKKHFYLIVFFISINIYSQKVEIFTDLHLGAFTNIPLKNFHSELVDDIPFTGLKTTDNFQINYGFSIGLKINKINTSFFYSQKVSGAKTSLKDFSGFISLKNEVKGSTFGAYYEKTIRKIGKGKLYLGFKGLVTLSNLTLKNDNLIDNNSTRETIIFKSTDFGTGLMLTYRLPVKYLIVKPFLGFDAYFGGKLKLNEVPDAHLIDSDGNDIKTGWTGINAGIGVAIPVF